MNLQQEPNLSIQELRSRRKEFTAWEERQCKGIIKIRTELVVVNRRATVATELLQFPERDELNVDEGARSH